MQRVRQFSAQRNELSKSRLNQSRKSGVSSKMNNSRVQKYQIATPVSNKNPSHTSSNNLSGSRASQRSSRSEYICTGCFNHKLASDRKQDRRNDLLRQKNNERYNTQISLRQDQEKYLKQSRLIKQTQIIKEYNKKQIQEKEKQKQKQLQIKNQLIQQQKAQTQAYIKQQKERQQQRYQVNQQFLKQIKHQIDQKHHKDKQLRQQQLKTQVADMFGSTQQIYFKQKSQKEHEYRQELLKQIRQRDQELKKQQAEKHNLTNIGIGISQAAYQRQIERQNKLHQRQQSLLQEAKRRKKIKQAQLEQQKRRQRLLEQQRNQQEQQKLNMQKQYSEQKQKQVHHYLQDLKHQIQLQKIKRQKEVQLVHQFTKTSIQMTEKAVDRKNCKSCDKKFPKTFLTKLK